MLFRRLLQHRRQPRTRRKPAAVVVGRRVAHEAAALARRAELHAERSARGASSACRSGAAVGVAVDAARAEAACPRAVD
eukprot:6035752-Prymnesium_polylepis.1